jgi:hypothetical protein
MLLSLGGKLRFLFRRQDVIHLEHHVSMRNLHLNTLVGTRLRRRANGCFIERAAIEEIEIAATTAWSASLLAFGFEALTVTGSDLLHLFLLRVRQVETLEEATLKAAFCAAALSVATARPATPLGALLTIPPLGWLLREACDCRQRQGRSQK